MDYFAEPAPLQQHMPVRTPPTIPQHSNTNYNQPLSSSSSASFNATNDLMLLGEPSPTPTNVYNPPHTAFTPPPPPADAVVDQSASSERPSYQPTAQAYPGYPSSLSVQKQDYSLATPSPQHSQHTQVQVQTAAPQPPPQQAQPQHMPVQTQVPVPAYQPPQLSSSSRPQAVNGILVPSIAPAPVSPPFQTSSVVQPSMKSDRVVQLLEQMQSNFDNIVQRLDGIENRMNSLELVTKEILGNQRIQSQQRKLQEPVDPPRVAFPPHTQPLYEAPRDDYLKKPAVYSPPPMPTPTISSSNHQMYPSVTSPAPPQMTFVQATQVKSPASYDADLELAKKLQASFDQETAKPEAKKPAPAAEVKTQECPMCQVKVSVADLEAHVESHFDDPVKKPAAKDTSKDSPKPTGFLNKLFGGKDEKDAKPDAVTKETPHPPATGYPRMVPASSFYGPGGYHYPNGYPAQMARPGTGRPGQQPYLYYPSAEQHQ